MQLFKRGRVIAASPSMSWLVDRSFGCARWKSQRRTSIAESVVLSMVWRIAVLGLVGWWRYHVGESIANGCLVGCGNAW